MIVIAVICATWFFVGTYQYGVWLSKKESLSYTEWEKYFDGTVKTMKSVLSAPFHYFMAVVLDEYSRDVSRDWIIVNGGALLMTAMAWFVILLVMAFIMTNPVLSIACIALLGGAVMAFYFGRYGLK